MISEIRTYWRIILLVSLVIASLGIVFSPFVPLSETETDTTSNLTSIQYSVELSGGTRIRAPLIGQTAVNATIGNSPSQTERKLAGNLTNTTPSRIIVRNPQNSSATIEIAKEVSTDKFRSALEQSNIKYESIRPGVTAQTREEAISTISSKINQAGLSGGSVRTVQSVDGRQLILVQVPQSSRKDTIELIQSRGEVRVDIYHDVVENGEVTYKTKKAVLQQNDFRQIGTPKQADRQANSPYVPVTLTDSAAERFERVTKETGVAQQGGTVCTYQRNKNTTDPCLLTVVDGEVIYSAGMNPQLAASISSGQWSTDPGMLLLTNNYSRARNLALNVRAGQLPAPMDLSEDSPGGVTFVSAQQGEQFRITAVLIAIVSSLTVTAVIGLRYQTVSIAVPMILTAFSEVVILLGIASILNYPVGLSVIAGLVAVIGTGVDDLVIIADRILSKDSSPPEHENIFSNRFRKALWIILSAAGTTILAIGPLALLNLQDLQGFAIFTIIGVVVGVTITRPAYGDILRYLLVRR